MSSDEDTDRIVAALGTLTRGPAGPSARWPDLAGLRHRIARRRRHRALAAGTTVLVVALAVVTGARLANSPHHATTPPYAVAGIRAADRVGAGVELVSNATQLNLDDPAAATAVARTEQAFSVALLQQVNSSSSANVAVSPMSLAIALSMLQNGAGGATRTEIQTALRSAGLSTAKQDAGWATLAANWARAGAAAGITLRSANSLWLQNGLPMQPAFMSELARYYAAGVWQVDFRHDVGAAAAAINAWTKQHTDGRIKQLFAKGQLNADTELALANAVYFNAAWQQPFDPDLTQPAEFTTGTGKQLSAEFMSNDLTDASAAVSSGYQAVELPYRGGRFAAVAVMPQGQSLSAFTRSLTPARLASITGSLHPVTALALRMPRFTATTSVDLKRPLVALGLSTAFTVRADFSGLSPKALQLQSAEQRVYLSVGEKGTEAAAATGLGMSTTSLPLVTASITLDHPFLFLIRDTTTGAILFAAQINNPNG